MFKAIKDWWTAKDREIARLQQEVKDANEAFGNCQNALFEAKNNLEAAFAVHDVLRTDFDNLKSDHFIVQTDFESLARKYQKLIEQYPDRKAEGVLVPWMEIKVDGESDLKGLKVSIDWNEAMVQHMKDKGHQWESENVMMQHFIVQLYEHVIVLLERRVMDEEERRTNSEFE